MAVVAGMEKPNDHAEPTKVELFVFGLYHDFPFYC